jgi:transcriptional regulator with XRE-family HTH domain
MRLIDELLIEKSTKVGKKLTQVDAAEACDLQPSTFYMIMTGKMSGIRSEDDLKRIARYFGKTLDWLKEQLTALKEG